jgi:hypothetical protein
MTVTYLDPTAEEATPVEPYELFLNLGSRPLTLGLLANSFPDAANFMDAMERQVAALVPNATIKRYQKPSVEPMSKEMLDDIARECDGLVAAWGH